MMREGNIVRTSAAEFQAMLDRGESRTDWERVGSMPQEEVERLADEEDGPLPEGWESTIEIGIPRPKQGVHIRLDADVLDWFRSHGPGYQTRMSAVLRAFVRARQKADEATSKG